MEAELELVGTWNAFKHNKLKLSLGCIQKAVIQPEKGDFSMDHHFFDSQL